MATRFTATNAAARSEFARFSFGGRQYRVDRQGERVYYTAEEIDARRTAAERVMAASCPPPH